MPLFGQVNGVHDIYDCVLLVTTFGGATAVRNVTNHGLRQSKAALAVACMLLLMNLTHTVLVPRSIDTLVEENESLANVTSTVNINRNDQDFVMKLLNSMSVSVTALASRLLTMSRMKHYLPQLLDMLARVDADLKLDGRVLQQNARFVYFMIIFLVGLCVPLQLISIFVIEPLQETFVTVMFTVNGYNNFTIACCEFQFIILTYLIKTRLKYINDRLNVYGNVQQIREKHTFLIDGTAGTNKRAARPTYYDIRMLYTSYKHLNGGLEQVNNYFNMQLLLSIACCNLNALISVYFAIFGGYYKPEDMTRAPQTAADTLNEFIWSTYYFIRFLLLSAFATSVINECMRTRIEVSKIQTKYFDVQSAEEIKYLLQFSANIRPKFTAFEFLTIDLHLVTSAIATGCTYLVIMAQFNNDKNGCKTKM